MSIDLNSCYCSESTAQTFSGNGNMGHFDVSESGADTEDGCYNNNDVDMQSHGETSREMGRENKSDDSNQGIDALETLRKSYEDRLAVGTYFDTLDEAHKLYYDYALVMGFSARKGSQGYLNPNKDVSYKLYHCSCEGRTDNKASEGKLAAYKKQTYRTQCKAMLRVARAEIESPWVITTFVKQHNHELVNPTESYLLRSARNMSKKKKSLLIAMRASGIGVSRAYRFIENEAGSRENVGFIRKDVYNELHRDSRNMSKINDGDANKLMEILTDRGMSDPSFFWKVKLSDDGRLKNLFFRDTRCLIDYQHFGDVLSVDATYKTNKYDLICVPLVGINHHRTNVMFGLGFLSNERAESYQWLFSTFLQAMYQKEPSIVFSDQDMAIMNAIDTTFRQASHRLCQWHINKNAIKHFGKLNQDIEFKNQWYRCMNGCENEEQFDIIWTGMIEEHNLLENRWFCTMYNLRKRWSSAFTRGKFSGGLHATSRSEVTNKVLKELCSTTSTLHEFVIGFEKMQKSWRTREFEEDALCRGMPGMFVQRTNILVQVAEACTRNVFKLFEFENLHTISVDLTQEPFDLNVEILEFKLSSSTSITGYRVVKYNQRTKFATCSCHLWETDGIICRHIFRVYLHFNLHKVPDEMLLNRWRKDSKKRLAVSHRLPDSAEPNKFSNMVFVNHNTKLVYDLLNECKDDSISRDLLTKCIANMTDAVKSLRVDSTCETTETAFGGGFKEPLVRPIKNPASQKKRPYRRMRFSKDRDIRGYDGASTSDRMHVDEETEEPFRSTQMSGGERYYRNVDDAADRFS